MAVYLDKDGVQQELKLSPTVYKEAINAGLTVPQHINRKYQTSSETSSTFDQLCQSSGLIVGKDREFGLRSPTIGAMLDGRAEFSGAVNVLDADPASRILYPAVVLEMMEDALQVDRTSDVIQLDRMIGREVSISSNRFEWPVISLKRAEGARSKAIAQLAEPEMMLTITASDQSKALLATSLGLEISDQALQATTLDFVGMAVARQMEVERNAKAYEWLVSVLNGDVDMAQAALDQTKADTFDSTIIAAGKVTKTAMVKWLVNNQYTRKVDWVVTDINGALAMEAAMENVNTNQYIAGSLVPQFSLVNRALSPLKVFIVEDGKGWPANTIMGLDSRYALTRVRNTAAQYTATESFLMRRSTQLRFDISELVYLQWRTAADVLSLTLSDT